MILSDSSVVSDICATVVSSTISLSLLRFGKRLLSVDLIRELLKGPLYYATTITFVSIFYWRTSPMAIAVVCNLCTGDGTADIFGRLFGRRKLPYNKNKSFAGSMAMFFFGFISSIGYMYYFSTFGFIHQSSKMVLGFMIVSLASALVESLPISTQLDDNLTSSLASILVGSLVF